MPRLSRTEGDAVKIILSEDRIEDYHLFLKIKGLPRYSILGHEVEFPDEYASVLGFDRVTYQSGDYVPTPGMFDYQRDISRLAIRKRKFAVFMDPGWGKTFIDFAFAQHALEATGKRVLFVAPLMVIRQMIAEARRFYGNTLPLQQVRAAALPEWICSSGKAFGITNYEAIRDDTPQGNLGALILSESSMLKSAYGKWGASLIRMGKGLEWKLCETGTPAPNDRIEFANHAVFLDQFPTTNAFLARFFINRGETSGRWEMKAHALRPFYRDLSHWSIFVSNPATYGWKDNVGTIPPIHVHFHDVELTPEQRDLVYKTGGDMFGTPGGITSRAKLSQLAKGRLDGEEVPTNKPQFIRDLVGGWREKESTLVWCVYNHEQETMERMFPDAASLSGDTPEDERAELLESFRSGNRKVCISKSKILGFGLNLQVATRQVFSGIVDSFESYFQCVKRSNRVGSTIPLNVHMPLTPIERPMVDTIFAKAKRIEQDATEQEQIFKEVRCD